MKKKNLGDLDVGERGARLRDGKEQASLED